jgi:hypothetical protein
MHVDAVLSRRKRPNEEFRISWDFTNDLEPGDPLAQQLVTAKDSAGVDVSGTFLQGAAITGTKIVVQAQGGSDGKDYFVTFKATTAGGDVFERVVRIRVRA